MYFSPRIVTSGLVLALDAADKNSYPGTGTNWNDLSGNNYIGTLTNGPTFNSNNRGSIVFDGVDDYVELNTTNIITGTNPFTIECWFNRNYTANGYGELFGNYGPGYSSAPYLWFATAGLYINGSVYISNYSTVTLGLHYMSCTRDSSGNTVVYLDGISKATGVLTTSVGGVPNFRIGADTNSAGGAGGEQFNGSIYTVRVYNKVLTATEVLQNYNATKTRFGL